MFLQATFARRPASLAPGLLIGAVVLWLCLTGTIETFVPRACLFYLATAAAYATMPYVRRGDIPLAAMWVVLGAELAPLMEGRLISPATVAADVAGVVMAAAPIFIARARQVMQGDLRPYSRRAREKTPD